MVCSYSLPSVVYLQLVKVPLGEAPLQLPPSLTTLNLRVQIIEGQQPCLEFITNILYQNKVIQKLFLLVRYSHQCAYLMTPAEKDAVASLDTTLAERVEFLVWEDILARPRTCKSRTVASCIFQEVCRAADEWMFKQALPKVTKKFFAGMPFPGPGDFHKGPLATRHHWDYIRFGLER